MNEPGREKPRSTARHTIDGVAQRVGVDADVLAYLFSECLSAVIEETEEASSCTIRGLGRFRLSTLEAALAAGDKDTSLLLFERTKHQVKNTAFAELKLASRMRGFTQS